MSAERLRSLGGDILILDTLVALLAGFMILPAVFAYGLDPAAGPGLTFVTLPVVFSQMPAGAIFGFVFFALLFVAALTSAVSLLEVVVTYLVDETRLTRRPAALIAGCICFGLGVPSSLSQGAVDIQIFGMDFLSFTPPERLNPGSTFSGSGVIAPADNPLHATNDPLQQLP